MDVLRERSVAVHVLAFTFVDRSTLSVRQYKVVFSVGKYGMVF